MATTPFLNQPFLYINDLQITNDATTPNTKLNIGTGQCRDSTDTYQMTNSASITINAATNGLNGLDTGTLAASKVYAVHLVSDPVTQQTTGAMISLSQTAPLMPFGYSAFRLIGYITTDSSVHFLPGFWSGTNSSRLFFYDAPQATAITAGADTSYTLITLTTLVPTVNKTPVWIASALTPGAASRTLKMQPAGAVGDAITITGQVTSVVVSSNSLLLANLSSAVPKIAYKVSNSGDAAAINVAGYQFYV